MCWTTTTTTTTKTDKLKADWYMLNNNNNKMRQVENRLFIHLWTQVEHLLLRWALSAWQWQPLHFCLHSSHMQFWMSDCSFTQRALNIHRSGYSTVRLLQGWSQLKSDSLVCWIMDWLVCFSRATQTLPPNAKCTRTSGWRCWTTPLKATTSASSPMAKLALESPTPWWVAVTRASRASFLRWVNGKTDSAILVQQLLTPYETGEQTDSTVQSLCDN